jgi:hypothetical protein
VGASGPGPSPCHRFDALWSDGEDGDGVIGVGTKRCGWDRNRLEDDDSLWSSTIVWEVEVVVWAVVCFVHFSTLYFRTYLYPPMNET